MVDQAMFLDGHKIWAAIVTQSRDNSVVLAVHLAIVLPMRIPLASQLGRRLIQYVSAAAVVVRAVRHKNATVIV